MSMSRRGSFASYQIIASEPLLIRGRIQSRHRAHTKYFFYILLDKSLPGAKSIIERYCQCLSGERTIGCCAHTMAVIWYLGFGKRLPKIPNPANKNKEILNELFAGHQLPPDDSDTDDDAL